MSFDLDAVRAQFPALSLHDGDLTRVYFDNPGGTQVPRSVVERMSSYLIESNSNLGGFFATTRATGEVVAQARLAVADLLNASSPDEIVFGPNMTSLTFHLSRSIGRCFQQGDEIVLSGMDHDGNVGPWLAMARDHNLTVKWLPFNVETFEFDLSELAKLLTNRTKLICVGAASNFLGTIHDVKSICAMAREVGAWTYIDAVQAVPHIVMDVQDLGCDFLVCSAYKFFGPHQGALWGKREVLESLEPYKVRPAPTAIPYCFETGTQNHEGMVGTTAAIDYLAWVGETMSAGLYANHAGFEGRRLYLRSALDLLFAYEMELARHLLSGLQAMPAVKVLGITNEDALSRRVPTVSFTVTDYSPAQIAEALASRGIFVWSGYYYAVEAAQALGVIDTGGAVRVGPVHYNSPAEIDRFLNTLDSIISRSNVA